MIGALAHALSAEKRQLSAREHHRRRRFRMRRGIGFQLVEQTEL
jgi:hypothetical protein